MAQIPFPLIVTRMREGRCVPFLGAAANISDSTRSYSGLPLGRDVSQELAKEVDGVPDPSNLPRVSLYHERLNDREFLITRLKQIIPEATCTPSPLLKTIASLHFRLIVTTNYDHLLERALDGKRAYRVITQTASGAENAPSVQEWAAIPPDKRPLLVYKIHGTFLDAVRPPGAPAPIECSPVIITEDDYIDFISVLSSDQLGVPQVVRAEMSYSTMLFLGYSLEDWDFRALYKSLVATLTPNGTRKSIAIQKDPSPLWAKFWQRRDVDIYDEHVYRFAEQLEAAAK